MADKIAELIKNELENLTREKAEYLKQVAEMDKKIKPLIAYLNAGKKKEGAKRGRKPKAAAEA